jgi:acyl-CoA synthetase (AMP-forming)/AMP-acid ligase II
VCDAIGIPPLEVVFVTPGTLPKTSSGKLQRSACKGQYRDDALQRA